VLPPGIQNEPRVKFDLTRRREWISVIREANGEWKFLPPPGFPNNNFIRFPDMLDEANDDGQGNNDEEGPNANGRMFVIDGPGPILDHPEGGVTGFKAEANFEEYVRVTIDGQQASGDGLKGSRASWKFDWHSQETLFVNQNTGKWVRAGAPNPNDIDAGHVPIDFPPGP
jgi:hypothetical protein